MAETRATRRWPAYLFGGRIRTSTAVLILAFVAIWWVYESYGPPQGTPDQVPAADVVPPGFIPDPAYTWVPRTDVQRGPVTTTSETPTTTATTTPTTSPVTTTPATTTPADDADADRTTTADAVTTTPASPPVPSPGPTPTATPSAPTP